jgi:hypothetical protein
MKNRDATKQARGFSYQRQYCIYLFFKSINTNIKKIIEEGNLEGSTYEDITTINNNDEYITYQIKYHTKKMCFNRSNSDLFKTIINKNNLEPKLKKIYFIVAKNNDTFDDIFNDWKNKNISNQDIYNKIIYLDKDDNCSTIDEYKECLTFLKTNPDDKILYLNKIIIKDGFTYDELIIKINDIIKNIFNINDDKIIYFIKYYVFDLFDKNWFNENIPLNINDIYLNIKFKISNIEISIENNEVFNDIFIYIIEKIKKYIQIINESNNIYLSNLLNEIKYFINQFYNNCEIKHCISLMQLLHKLNEKTNNEYNEINELYKITNIHLRRTFINMIKTTDKKFDDDIISSIFSSFVYYNKHNIKKSIKISKSHLKDILSKNDIDFITNNE